MTRSHWRTRRQRNNERGEFELRFVRPGKHYIQADPFWLVAEEGPRDAWKLVEASAERPVEGVVLQVDEDSAPSGRWKLKFKAAEDLASSSLLYVGIAGEVVDI